LTSYQACANILIMKVTHYSDKLDFQLEPLSRHQVDTWMNKPMPALWCCEKDDWLDFCQEQYPVPIATKVTLEIDESRLLVVDAKNCQTLPTLESIAFMLPTEQRKLVINWHEVARQYDAILFTTGADWRLRNDARYFHAAYDVPTVMILDTACVKDWKAEPVFVDFKDGI